MTFEKPTGNGAAWDAPALSEALEMAQGHWMRWCAAHLTGWCATWWNSLLKVSVPRQPDVECGRHGWLAPR